ncbi:MAG: acetyl-CoA carboxylase carboxyltransferase subunit alpha [Candidatus Anammoxibacter sp.]
MRSSKLLRSRKPNKPWNMMENNFLNKETAINEIDDRIRALKNRSEIENVNFHEEIDELEKKKDELYKEIFANLSPYEIVKIARHPLRPSSTDYIAQIVDDFTELHGDRRFGNDKAIMTGIGIIDNKEVMIIAHCKGKSTKERIACNFGMPNPEGYRKALLKMKLAEKFKLPIITLIDTPGANPDIGAEERGQAQAIAENIHSMFMLRTPIISVVIGEGGSGGALGIGVCDRFSILQYAYFSVISPEGCAAILWKHSKHAEKAANALKLTALDLYELGIVDEIIPEPIGAANRNPKEMATTLKEVLIRNLRDVVKVSIDTLLDDRYKKYRKIGEFFEE